MQNLTDEEAEAVPAQVRSTPGVLREWPRPAAATSPVPIGSDSGSTAQRSNKPPR